MPARGNTAKLDEVASALKARIASGDYPPGAFLPAERTLAKDLSVARNTLRAALDLLDDEGLVRREGRRGTRVREILDAGVGGTILLILSQSVRSGVSLLSPEGMALLAGVLSACSGSDIRFRMQGMPDTGHRGLLRLIRRAKVPGVLLIECHQPEILSALHTS